MTIKAIKLYCAILSSKGLRVVEFEPRIHHPLSSGKRTYELHAINQYHDKDWYRICWGYSPAELAIAAVKTFNQSPYLAEKFGLKEYVGTKNRRNIESD